MSRRVCPQYMRPVVQALALARVGRRALRVMTRRVLALTILTAA